MLDGKGLRAKRLWTYRLGERAGVRLVWFYHEDDAKRIAAASTHVNNNSLAKPVQPVSAGKGKPAGSEPSSEADAGEKTQPQAPDQATLFNAETGRVKLFGVQESPIVNGKLKPRLTLAQYEVVVAVIQAGEDGLTMEDLIENSGRGGARIILRRLANSDPDWKAVIHPAGRRGGRYKIA